MTTETTEEVIEAPECDHFAHYRQTRDWTDDHQPAGWTSTCSECGHVWKSPAPILEVEVSFKIEARATVDLTRYFNGLSDGARKQYAEFDLDGEGYYAEPWERPMAWLVRDDDDVAGSISVVPHRVFGERGQPQPIREEVDVDEVEARVKTRPGVRAYNQDWTQEDMETLRFHVPWLNKVHELLEEGDGDIDPEELARIPGPLDTPLEGLG